MSVAIYEHILWLDIPMHYTVSMNLLYSQDQLSQVNPGMRLAQSPIHLLVNDRAHVAARAIVCHHVQIFEGLEGIVQLRHKPMVYLSLDLLLSDHKTSKPVVSPLFHALHRVKLAGTISVRLETLDEVYLCVGTLAKHTDALEVLSLHVKSAQGQRSRVLSISSRQMLIAYLTLFLL